MANVVVFDDGLGLLSPLTDLRPAFEVRTGAFTLIERLERAGHKVSTSPSGTGPMLLINGRCPLPPDTVWGLRTGQAIVEESTRHIIAAHTEGKDIQPVLRGEPGALAPAPHREHALIARPWHIRTFRDRCIRQDLSLLLGESPYTFRVAATAKAHASTIFDTEHGHVFIDEHAVIRPGAIICGPAYIGPHSTVLEHALIKGGTAIGPWCKVAGEVAGTIFQGYANKAHDGHLGDSWVGEWANLGAGTTNSNLLNTYGEVIARPLGKDRKPGPNERTGEQFLGATIGDHVKTAICTRIMTGAIVGTGTMFAASGPLSGTVPPLSWITDSGTRVFAMEKFVEIARSVMGRRRIAMTDAYHQRLKQIGGSKT